MVGAGVARLGECVASRGGLGRVELDGVLLAPAHLERRLEQRLGCRADAGEMQGRCRGDIGLSVAVSSACSRCAEASAWQGIVAGAAWRVRGEGLLEVGHAEMQGRYRGDTGEMWAGDGALCGVDVVAGELVLIDRDLE